MRIVILGAGQVGRTAAWHLAREEANEVTVVDHNEEALRDLQDRLDIRTVRGNAASPLTLERAGVGQAQIVIALTSSDEVNMLACQIAHTLYRTQTKIARIRSNDYFQRAGLLGGDGGLAVDMWISPEQLVTDYIERLIQYPGALQVLDFADGRVRLVAVHARRDGLLVGHQLRELRTHIPDTDARVAAIYRRGRSVVPEGGTVIEPDDEVFFIAARDDIRLVMNELRRGDEPVRRVVIAGGGNIGLRLARALEERYQVKLIERDRHRARKAAEALNSTTVLNGDAADEDLLLEENIDSADAFVAVTNSEEANILSAMLAKRLGAHKSMALINKPSYAELIEEGSSLDVAISPQTVTIGSLLAHVRRGDVVKVHSLRRGAAEALETVVHGDAGNSQVVGRSVGEVRLPEGVSIAALVRGEHVLIAHRGTVIEAGDHVILFLTDRRHIEEVGRLFQAGR